MPPHTYYTRSKGGIERRTRSGAAYIPPLVTTIRRQWNPKKAPREIPDAVAKEFNYQFDSKSSPQKELTNRFFFAACQKAIELRRNDCWWRHQKSPLIVFLDTPAFFTLNILSSLPARFVIVEGNEKSYREMCTSAPKKFPGVDVTIVHGFIEEWVIDTDEEIFAIWFDLMGPWFRRTDELMTKITAMSSLRIVASTLIVRGGNEFTLHERWYKLKQLLANFDPTICWSYSQFEKYGMVGAGMMNFNLFSNSMPTNDCLYRVKEVIEDCPDDDKKIIASIYGFGEYCETVARSAWEKTIALKKFV